MLLRCDFELFLATFSLVMMPNMRSNFLNQENKTNTYSLAILLSLYLVQGLPSGFMTQALPALLRHYGVSLAQIGLSGLLMLPWAIKFLWAPYVDQHCLFGQGHYRSWILLLHFAMMLILVALSFIPIDLIQQSSMLWLLFIGLFLLNLFCATQDIASDGLTVNILQQKSYHWGNMMQVIGSRLGYFIGGGLLLYFIDIWSWQTTFLLLAGLVLLNTILIFNYQEKSYQKQNESEKQNDDKKSKIEKIKSYFCYLFSSSVLKAWLLVLLSYKVADGLFGAMNKPMLIDMGLSLADIGIYITGIGVFSALCGAGLSAWLIECYRNAKMFWYFSILQIASFVAYASLIWAKQHGYAIEKWHFYLVNAYEECISAMSLVALLSIIVQYCRKQFAGTDFTVQVSIMTMISGVLYSLSGILAQKLGYVNLLILIIAVSFVMLIPKYYWYRLQAK